MSVSLQLILKGQKTQQDALEGLKIQVFKGKGEEKKKKNSINLKIGPQGIQNICQETLFFNTLLHIKTADILKQLGQLITVCQRVYLFSATIKKAV